MTLTFSQTSADRDASAPVDASSPDLTACAFVSEMGSEGGSPLPAAAPAAALDPGGIAMRAMRAITRPKSRLLAALDAAFAQANAVLSGPVPDISPRSVKTGASFSYSIEKKGKHKKEAPRQDDGEIGPKAGLSPCPFGDRPAPQTVAEIIDMMDHDYLTWSLPASDGTMKCKVGGEDETHIIAQAIRFFEGAGMVLAGDGAGGRAYRRRLDFALMDERERPVRVLVGSYTGGVPHMEIRGGGGLCAALAPAAQAAFPDGRAGRVDVKLDLVIGPEGFDALYSWAERFATGRRRPGAPILDPRGTAEGGRTFYMGARESTVYLRVYEKGLQLIGAGQDADPRLVRIEFELKDFYSWEKAEIFQLSPGDALRSKGGWGRKWLEGAISALKLVERPEVIVLRHMITARPVKTLADSADHGVRQYGKTFVRLAVDTVVHADFGGNRAAAVLDPEEIEDKAVEQFRTRLRASEAVHAVLSEQGLLHAEDPDERARRMAEESAARGVLAVQKDASVRRRIAVVAGLESSAAKRIKESLDRGADRSKQRADDQHTAATHMRDAMAVIEARHELRVGQRALAEQAQALGVRARRMLDISRHMADPDCIEYDAGVEVWYGSWVSERGTSAIAETPHE